MNKQKRTNARGSPVVALALLLAGAGSGVAVRAADVPRESAPANAAEPDEQLDEVVVTGAKRVKNAQKIVDWLKRLVGQFSYEGYVDLRSEGAPQGRKPVNGVGDCVGFGPGPGVQCVMKVIWPEVRGANGADVPGGVSSLAPAMILYGLDPDYLGIRYMQLDNKGLAEGGLGLLVGETLTSKAPCVTIPDKCERIMKINARPDGKVIQMQIDIEQDENRVVRFMFVMHRLQDQASVPAGASGPAGAPRPGGAPRR